MKLTIILILLTVLVAVSATSIKKDKYKPHKGDSGSKENKSNKSKEKGCGGKTGKCGEGHHLPTKPPTKPPTKLPTKLPCGHKGGCGEHGHSGGHHSGSKSSDESNSGPIRPTRPPCDKKGGCGGHHSGSRSSEDNSSGSGKPPITLPTRPPTKPTKPTKPPTKPCHKKGGCGGHGSHSDSKSSDESDSGPIKPTRPPTKLPTKPPCGKKGGCGGHHSGSKSSDDSSSGSGEPPITKPTRPPTKPTRPPTKPTKPCNKKHGCGGHGSHSESQSSDESNSGPTKPPTKPTKPANSDGSASNSESDSSSDNKSDSSACRQSSEEIIPPPDDHKSYDTVKIVKSYHYPCESHEVITTDGFRIIIHRIPSNNKNKPKHRKPVLLIGDFWTSSLFWVISGKEYSLAIYLSDIGFDVWLANDRGNQYGQQHVNFDINHPSYWDYSFGKIGKYDIPAMIDYILAYHKCEKISIIAWGYGATACFAMVSDRPKYANLISSLQALAPTVYMQHTQSLLLLGFSSHDQQSIFNKIGRYQIIQNKNLLQKGGRPICRRNSPNKSYCDYIQPLFSAPSIFGIDNPYYPAILNSPRSQSSVKFFFHMLQQVASGCFKKYDFGVASNQLRYGSDNAPLYDLSAAIMPVAVYYSNDDSVAVPADVLNLWDKLPNKIEKYCIEKPGFSHVHFAISEDAKHEFYGNIKYILENHD